MLKKLILLVIAFATFSRVANAQGGFTTVTGTITGPIDGIVWACGTISAQLITAGGTAPTLNGGGFTTSTSPVSLGCPGSNGLPAGSFSIRLADSGVISPSTTTWQFTVNMAPGIAPPAGTGPQSFTYTTAINCSTNTPSVCTANSMSISAQLSALAPKLSNTSGGIGTGFPVTTAVNVNSGGSITVNTGGSIGTAGSGTITATQVTNAPVPSSAFTFYPATSAACTTYSASGTNFCALNNSTGALTTNTDFGVLFNNVTTANATVGGRLFFKNGVYSVNSMTVETATGCSTFDGSGVPIAYALAFPSNTPFSNSVQWLLEGETAPVWQGEAGSTSVNNAGVIINITPTAVSSVTAGDVLAGFWGRPVTNCTLTAASGNVSNDVHYNNLSLRFPTNQRGNEIGFASYFLGNVEYENAVSDFNLPYNTIATGSAPVAGTYGSFGQTSTVSSSGNWQSFLNTFAVGWNICYDFQSEHIRSWQSTAIYCNFPFETGRDATSVFHPIKIINFHDQENKNGGILGQQMSFGSRVDVDDLDVEIKSDGNWYARTAGLYTEQNCNFGTGRWTYSVVASGISTMLPLFSSCGGELQINAGAGPDNLAYAVASDPFTHPASAPSWGPYWVNTGLGNGSGNGCSNTTISGNTATTSGVSACYYNAQVFNPPQFSQVTVSAITSTTAIAVTAMNSITAANKSGYEYACSTSGGTIAKRGIYLVSAAGAASLLNSTQTAANSGCVANDVIRLEVIPTGSTNRIIAYYNGSKDLETQDSTLAGGNPGLVETGGSGVAAINWTGGNLPTRTGADTIYQDSSYTTLPRKSLVDTAAYTNATTTFSNVIGAGATNGLSFTIDKNIRYTMHCSIVWQSSVLTAGPQFQITGPAAPTSVAITMISAITAATTASAAATAFSSPLNPVGAAVTATTNEVAYIDMELINGANSGVIQLQAAAQGVGTLTIQQGSGCTLQ
jgi:hypothetical protein